MINVIIKHGRGNTKPPLQVVSKSLLATYKGGENIVNSGRFTVKVLI